MPEVHFSLLMKAVVVVLAAFGAAGLSFFVYRVTVPVISAKLKIVLTSLRAVGLFLVFFLLGEPLLSLVTRTLEPPVVAILLDDSRSMSLHDAGARRKKQLTDELSVTVDEKISKFGQPRYAVFSGGLRLLNSFRSDSLKLEGEATDIAAALKSAKEQMPGTLQAILLVTDGNSTTGANPLYEAENLGVPVFTVGFGDTVDSKDVLIRKTAANEIAYVGNSVPVTVTLRSSGFDGERLGVLLRDGATVLDRRIVVLEKGSRDYEVQMAFTPTREGLQKFTVELSQLPDELTEKNNKAMFFTKVLKSRMRVVLISNAPGQDVAFLRRSLESDKNIELKTFVERGNGQFYDQPLSAPALQEAECILLAGFPSSSSSDNAISLVRTALGTGKPLLYVFSRQVDQTKISLLDSWLPFSVAGGSPDEFQVFMAVPETQRTNVLMKLGGKPESFDRWSKLPPIFRTQTNMRVKPESEILATARIQNTVTGDPLIVRRNIAGKKSIAILGYGLWRWKLLSEEGSGTETVLDEFLGNSVRWLTAQEDEKQILVQPAKQVFTTQEPVELSAQIYDQSLRPVEDAQINLLVRRSGQTNELSLSSLGNGRYGGSLGQLEEGDYEFTGKVTVGGKLLAEQRGRFSVGGMSAEFLETRMRKPLMELIAARTGGKYYDLASLHSFTDDLKNLQSFQPREVIRSEEIQLRFVGWLLSIIVSIFVLEWFLRKRNGML